VREHPFADSPERAMSLDPSLKVSTGALATKRSVLKRAERIARLKENTSYDPKAKPVLGLRKTKST
jgi:small basic protein (TIGR04137 family)